MGYNSLSELFKATADAIRSKTGSTALIVANDFPAAIAAISGGSSVPDEEWIGDGNTHIWITLHEGRTSPMLGVCPNGTVTVDWGDGTTPNVLTGTSTTTVKWTPNHEYAKPGDYVITLTVDGTMGFGGANGDGNNGYILRHGSGSDLRNIVYANNVRKVEIGNNVREVGGFAFYNCYSLKSVVIPDGVTAIGTNAFYNCYSLKSVVIPDGVTAIGQGAFDSCYSLESIVIPDGVTAIARSTFSSCYSLESIVIPDGATDIGISAFASCYSLTSIVIPDRVTTIAGSVFAGCRGVRTYDFTKHTTVPTLSGTGAFSGIAGDCEIRVPAALYDEWIAATNWTTYASQIVAV